ncbi:E3 ubiquitin-protein ligase RNF181 [Culicoides brevitarsis]|uniref:E3 ubiquitin-protein ligase RNF181 n=1 Tax=Culicoides brevitarsis TaxID=469753 RepID=UPI00307BD68D
MTDYFEELNCQPIPDEEVQSHQLMLMVRFMRQNGFLNEDFERELRAPPAAKEVIEALKEKRVTKDDEKCTICLKPNDEPEPETGTLNDLFKILPCKHEFHATCILPWLAKTNSCPLCRFEMKTDDEIYEEQKRHRARQAQREAEIESLHDSMYG